MATRSKTKTQARQASADKRPKAIAKYVRISPRKVKIVIDLIRGKNVDEAAAILTYTPKAASPVVLEGAQQRHRQRGEQPGAGPQGAVRC